MTNPTDGWLESGRPQADARIGAEALQAYADALNARGFTRATGCVWFVNRRLRDDGSEERFLDRRSVANAEPWTPTPGEKEAIRARNAEFLQRGMSPAEFNRLVDEGRLA